MNDDDTRYEIEWYPAATGGVLKARTVESKPGETWAAALARDYNHDDRGKLKGKYQTVALSHHFPGGDTWHVQMGHRLQGRGDSTWTLDPTIVVHVRPIEEEV